MKKKRRSREFKKNSDIIDIEEARERRRRRREKLAAKNDPQAASVHRKRRKKRSVKAVYVVLILIAVVAIGISSFNLISLKAQERQVLAEQKELEEKKADMEKELEKLDDPEYIEKEAREQLKLVMPGEKLYFFPQDNNDNDSSGEEKTDD